MSHVAKLDIELKDLDAIRNAVKRIGGIWKEGQKRYAWYGRHVGDYPLPEGFTATDLGKCDHAFGFDGASYEIGVVRRADGTYAILWDFYSPGGLLPHMGGETADKFKQAYAIEKAKIEARKKGMIVREKTLPNGAVQLSIGKL